MEDKKYKVPEELEVLMDKATSAIKLRDIYVRIPFCFRKACKYGNNVQKYKRLFWKKVLELYPELESKKNELNYDINDGCVRVITKKKKV